MEQTLQPSPDFKRFDIPVKMGLLIAIIKIVLATIQYQFFLGTFIASTSITVLSVIIGLILLYVTGVQQRNAMGGYINIKEAFQAIFVAILIMVVLTSIYDVIYMKFIDPGMIEKIKESSVGFAERMGAPEEELDRINKQIEDQQDQSFGKQSVSYLSMIIIYSIAGLIISAIIKKNKPEHLA